MLDQLDTWLVSLIAFATAVTIVLAVRPRLDAVFPSGTVRRLHGPPHGGIAVVLAILVSSLAFVPLDGAYRGILIGVAVIAGVGILADVRGLPTLVMFLCQIGVAGIAVAYGVSVERFTFPLVGVVAELPAWADVPLTITWIVVLVRLVDFVDGLDGLAAAICGAASATFVLLSLGLEVRASAIFSAIIAGACAGFLFRNFFPSKILLGHVGSLVLGYSVATVSVEGLLKTAAIVGVLFPFLILAVPALDSSLAVARRFASRVDPRSVGAGSAPWSRRRIVLVLAGWCIVVGATVLASSAIDFRDRGEWDPWRTLLVAGIVLLVLASSLYVVGLIEFSRPSRRRADHEEQRQITRPSLGGDSLSVLEVDAVGGTSPAEAAESARSSWYGRTRSGTDLVLRVLDIAIAGSALVLLSPILGAIAALALVTSGRPILYAGSRVGHEGHVFTMWKIRTLKVDADARVGEFYGAELDRRTVAETTRIGRILRATHLDEAPQLWNVITGDMSVVGPRPLRPRFFEELCAEIPQYWQRLTVRPGLTGLAQIRIDRAAGWDEKLAHDLEWIADRSVRLYLATALATVWRILKATVSVRRQASRPTATGTDNRHDRSPAD